MQRLSRETPSLITIFLFLKEKTPFLNFAFKIMYAKLQKCTMKHEVHKNCKVR